MEKPLRREQVELYTRYSRGRVYGEDFFLPVMVLSFLFFGAVGWYLRTHNPPPMTIEEQAARLQQTRFIFEAEKSKPKMELHKPQASKKVEPVKKEPIDLAKKPLLDQKKDEIVETPPTAEPVKQPPRRVYGLKKVYSMGIGASGSAADAIIGKRGNTLDTGIDTIIAAESDLRSAPVSITSVTTQPRIIRQVKPEYSKEMLENRVEGVVRVKVLIDIDGRVKQVIVLDDLGYGSKEKVADACFKTLFSPALRGSEPVSVWIMIKFRFEMLEG